jgi:ABC-type lipoprotein release transport system permease subunit
MRTETRGSLTPARLRPSDVVRTGVAALRARPTRVALSALGVAIGIATMVAVVGVSQSSQAHLLRQLDQLGTDLLTVSPGQTLRGEDARLPVESVAMVGRIAAVRTVAATADIDAHVYRSDQIPETQTGGIGVLAVTSELLTTLKGHPAKGMWFNDATSRFPTTVLGSVAAGRLGVSTGDQVWLADRWFTVLGVLHPLPLAPEVDRSALVGWVGAGTHLGFDGHPTTIYERSDPEAVEQVRSLLPRTVNPANPEEVQVSRPSDALAARAAAAGAYTSLLLGLGGVALLVGGVGIANTMVISVLERRGEIGLRRSMGATRGQIRLQFVAESLLLSAVGGAVGAVLGTLGTAVYATVRDLPPVVPPWALAGGVIATVPVGMIAGLYPAMRAARLSPTVALAAP